MELGCNHVDDVEWGQQYVGADSVLVGFKRLKDLKLGCEQRRRHEIVNSTNNSILNDLLFSIQKNKVRVGNMLTENVAVRPSQGGAGDNEAAIGLACVGEVATHSVQPWLPLGIRERTTRRHLRNVVGWM